jgi:hypothetical protein
VTEDLTNKIIVWTAEVASYAVRLPSRKARDDYLRERHRELVTGGQAEGATLRDAEIVADACVDAARGIMTELLVLCAYRKDALNDRKSTCLNARFPS